MSAPPPPFTHCVSLLLISLFSIPIVVAQDVADLRINELLASNDDTLEDGSGGSPDWIEIYNSGAGAVSMAGMFLTDDPDALEKWAFPDIDIPAGGYLVVFASGRDSHDEQSGEVHASFRLNSQGEYVALAQSGGTVLREIADGYPVQKPDISYGADASSPHAWGYFNTPTPGAPNGTIDFARFLASPTFNVERGFYEEPFSVTIASAEPGADLVYTTDASTPSADNGTRISAASPDIKVQTTVDVETTAVLRAVSVKAGLPSYKAATATYLFLDDVLDQPRVPEGYPSTWFSAGSADYEMGAAIVGKTYSREELRASLRSLPTISLVTDIPNLFDRRTGLQINPQREGEDWEKASSIELIDFEDGDPAQFDCGWRMSGNASRSPSRPKHNLRIVFRPDYDKTPLEYPLFGTLEVQRFRTFILRGFNGDSWIHPGNATNGQYIRDQWFRDAHRAMGHEETLQREVHVYYNGLYWGVHHMFERTEDDFAVEHFGGETDDWDGVRITAGGNVTTIDGTLDAWNDTRTLARARDYEGVQEYLEMDAFIDYLLINFYGGNGDWDQNNVRALRSRAEGGRWRFFCHDSERAGLNAGGGGSINTDVTTKNTARGPTEMHQRLASNEEYRMRFADRAHKHLFNDGALTPARAEALWRARADGIREALKAESARWGDAKRSRPMTLVEWERLVDREYTTWFPARTAVTIGQLKRRKLYPDLAAPVLSQHGGIVESGFPLAITNEEGDIYYTFDGSDPRLKGGMENPAATQIAGATEVVDVFGSGADWRYFDTGADLGGSAITSGAAGYGVDNWKHPDFADGAWKIGAAPLGYGGIGSAALATEIDFGGDRGNRFVTTYFRRVFEVADLAAALGLSLDLMRDDGAIVYVNGIEVAHAGMPDGDAAFDTIAVENVTGESESTFETVELRIDGLMTGANVIAVEIHQVSTGSSDMGFDAALRMKRLNEGNRPVTLSPPVTVKARGLKDGEWSALTEATFVSGLAPMPASLAVTELHYNPGAPTPDELAQPFVADNDDFEFLELRNISGQAIDLSGARFTRGIDFVFPDDSPLESGAFTIVARNLEAFRYRYADLASVDVAGEFANGTGLSNGGEWVTLEDAAGGPVLNFRYDDRAPWPEQADGSGMSLVFSSEQSTNPNVAGNWSVSPLAGGHPGSDGNGAVFPSDNIDADGNGLSDFLDFVFGNTAGDVVYPGARFDAAGDGGEGGVVLLEFRLNTRLSGLGVIPEISEDLVSWHTVSDFERSEELLGADMAMVTLRIPVSAPVTDGQEFYRICIEAE